MGSDPGGGGTAATNAMILLNKATSTPGTPGLADYPGIYHRSIASGEVSTLGDSTNNIVLDASGLGIISPNFITFQTGSSSKINSIVINNAGNVSVLGRTNLNGPVSVGRNFTDVQTHQSLVPMMDISGTMSLSSMDTIYNDVPRIKLISNSIKQENDIPITSTSSLSTSNEIRGVVPTLNSGFLRLTAQSPGNSCIDLIGQNISGSAGRFNNSVRISTNAAPRMVVNGSGNVGIGTMDPSVTLDVAGVARVTAGSSLTTALTTTGRVGVNNASPTATLDVTGDVKVSSTLTTVGNVGVATASPTAPLDVTGNAILRNQVRIGSSVAPTTTLDVTGVARVNSGATTSTALTTTGRVGINQAAPTATLDVTGDVKVSSTLTTVGNVGVATASPTAPLDVTGNAILRNSVRIGSSVAPTTTLDVTGAARIAGTLDMNSNKIFNLANPAYSQDAATKIYVDNATSGMATSSSVSSAITTALGSGSQTNNPTIYDTGNQNASFRLVMSQQTSGRATLYNDEGLTYNSSTNKLTAGAVTATGNFYTDEYITGAVIFASGAVGYNMNVGTSRYFNLSGSIGSVGAQYITNISIVSENSIWIKGTHLWVTSDQRIKKNIVNLNTDKMMNIFRNIRPISFDFIDPIKNNNKKHFGFIAQEVNEVLPEGISINTDVIPNNMMKAEITKPSKTDENPNFTLKPDDTDIILQYLLLTTDKPISFDISNSYSSKDTYKFKVYCGKEWSKEHDIYIRSEYNVIDDKYTYDIGMKKEAYDVVITEPTLFVYGQYVYDLHILEHDTIYTVATAALQEVDRQQQADKARIAELENHVSILEAKVSEQQSLINDILERLKSNGM